MWRGYTLEWTKNDGTALVGHQTCLEWTKNDGTALVGHQTCLEWTKNDGTALVGHQTCFKISPFIRQGLIFSAETILI